MTFRILCSLAALIALASARAQEADKEVEARKVALEVAGAFSNDGFKIRDGHWSGEVKPGEPAVVAVNLYAGNQYWFSVGTDAKDAKFSVQLHDENGKPVTGELYEGDANAAAGVSPTVSGQYFVSLTASEGAAGTYCLAYSYK